MWDINNIKGINCLKCLFLFSSSSWIMEYNMLELRGMSNGMRNHEDESMYRGCKNDGVEKKFGNEKLAEIFCVVFHSQLCFDVNKKINKMFIFKWNLMWIILLIFHMRKSVHDKVLSYIQLKGIFGWDMPSKKGNI